MRTALFLIALSITDLAPPDVQVAKTEIMSILIWVFYIFAVMDIVDFFRR